MCESTVIDNIASWVINLYQLSLFLVTQLVHRWPTPPTLLDDSWRLATVISDTLDCRRQVLQLGTGIILVTRAIG